jgi:ABC-type glycerol-3-phosphate transport system substrate-binding protein
VDPDRFRGGNDAFPGHWWAYPANWHTLPESALEERETLDVVLRAIEALPPAQRTVIAMRDIQGCGPDEVCAVLEISDGNQRVLLHRARSRVRGGDAPEIALFPQPGLLLDMSPDLAPFDEAGIDVEALSGTLIPGFLDSATRDGQVYGAPVNMAVKSLVWYPKQAFEDAGYEVPETHAELLELSDQIVSDGGTPWCVGIESGPDTGWPATDWLEDYVLRTAGPDAYDQWVAGELGFASPEVTEAAETAGDILLNDDYVDGGGRAIVNTPFGDAPRDMFDEEPGCWLHRQASFITTFFPEEVQEDLDEVAGVFMLPPVEGHVITDDMVEHALAEQ